MIYSAMPAYDLVFFDCDSTLSSIEGIDELASRAGVDVSELTNAAICRWKTFIASVSK